MQRGWGKVCRVSESPTIKWQTNFRQLFDINYDPAADEGQWWTTPCDSLPGKGLFTFSKDHAGPIRSPMNLNQRDFRLWRFAFSCFPRHCEKK